MNPCQPRCIESGTCLEALLAGFEPVLSGPDNNVGTT